MRIGVIVSLFLLLSLPPLVLAEQEIEVGEVALFRAYRLDNPSYTIPDERPYRYYGPTCDKYIDPGNITDIIKLIETSLIDLNQTVSVTERDDNPNALCRGSTIQLSLDDVEIYLNGKWFIAYENITKDPMSIEEVRMRLSSAHDRLFDIPKIVAQRLDNGREPRPTLEFIFIGNFTPDDLYTKNLSEPIGYRYVGSEYTDELYNLLLFSHEEISPRYGIEIISKDERNRFDAYVTYYDKRDGYERSFPKKILNLNNQTVRGREYIWFLFAGHTIEYLELYDYYQKIGYDKSEIDVLIDNLAAEKEGAIDLLSNILTNTSHKDYTYSERLEILEAYRDILDTKVATIRNLNDALRYNYTQPIDTVSEMINNRDYLMLAKNPVSRRLDEVNNAGFMAAEGLTEDILNWYEYVFDILYNEISIAETERSIDESRISTKNAIDSASSNTFLAIFFSLVGIVAGLLIEHRLSEQRAARREHRHEIRRDVIEPWLQEITKVGKDFKRNVKLSEGGIEIIKQFEYDFEKNLLFKDFGTHYPPSIAKWQKFKKLLESYDNRFADFVNNVQDRLKEKGLGESLVMGLSYRLCIELVSSRAYLKEYTYKLFETYEIMCLRNGRLFYKGNKQRKENTAISNIRKSSIIRKEAIDLFDMAQELQSHLELIKADLIKVSKQTTLPGECAYI